MIFQKDREHLNHAGNKDRRQRFNMLLNTLQYRKYCCTLRIYME